MENMNDIVASTDVVEDLAEVTEVAAGSGLQKVAKIGIIGIAGIACWEFVVKPVWRKIKKVRAQRKERKAQNQGTANGEDFDVENMNIKDLPEVDEN